MGAARKMGTASDEAIAALLRESGLKRTSSRIEVVRVLTKSRRPMSHPDVVEALADRGFDRVTLYRNLLDLSDVGVLRRTDLGDHVWRYELVSRDKNVTAHPHFVCTDCGRVACLTGVAVEITTDGAAPHAVRSHKVEVQLSGRCNACA